MKTRTAHLYTCTGTLLLICTCIGFCELNFMFSFMSSPKTQCKDTNTSNKKRDGSFCKIQNLKFL